MKTKMKEKMNRRNFITTSGLTTFGVMISPDVFGALTFKDRDQIKAYGPGADYIPSMKIAFVRRKEEYGMWWPGQIYDGEAALKSYKKQILESAKKLDIRVDIRKDPIHSPEEADGWVQEAKDQNPDGLMVIVLDRQQHAWPTVDKAIDSNIPTIVFSPLGTSFTTNTFGPSKREGVFICSTDDFSQAAFGMKMIKAGAKLRETRYLVIWSDKRRDAVINHFGTKLRYIPAQDFIDAYNNMEDDQEINRLAEEVTKNAQGIHGPSNQDVYNGIKSYLVAKELLERERCDAITMDCLGTLAKTDISLPCIAWSKINDHAVPAACEADLGACVTHALVQYLFDRPGFQQDPVAETVRDCLIGSHCSCATRLNGFTKSPEPYDIVPHHGNRDATVNPVWKQGQRVTVADVILTEGRNYSGFIRSDSDVVEKENISMIISSGEVVDQKKIPPSGGCVVAPMVKLDNVSDLLDYPGFHQIFFYGDYKKELESYCRLYGIKPVIV